MFRPLFSTLLLAGCAGMGPTAEKPCFYSAMSWNMDDQNPIARITMLNLGRFCAVTVRNDGRAAEGSGSVVSQPAHGTARVRRVTGAMQAQYLPTPGFVGEDSYRVRLGPSSQVITVFVTVRPPAA